MPFRMVFANPFVLAAMTVVAIGVITYQILNNKKKIPVRSSGRGGGGPYGPDDGSGRGSRGGDSGGGSRGDDSKETPQGWTINTSDNGGKVEACDISKSEKPNKDSSVIRRRNVAASSASDNMSETENNHPSSPTNSFDENSGMHSDLSNSFDENSGTHSDLSNSFDENSGMHSDLSTNENSSTAKQINKIQKANCNNNAIKSQETFVANINENDEDSDSSESNASLNSNQNDNMSVFSNESNCSKESSLTTKYKNKRTSSSVDNSEELYKRKVCNYLKNNIDKEDSRDKTSDDLLKSKLSVDLDEPSSSGSTKPVLCKGCLEDIANAVAYPCQHCYLCLDCAIKVHRIYKKCSICQSVVKTFEQLKM